jgi:uncharacterized RDD family membrane protein YckC
MKTMWKVKLVVYFAPLLGLCFELIALSTWARMNLNEQIIEVLMFTSPRVGLNFIDFDLWLLYDFVQYPRVNLLDLTFYVALLIGIILYALSKGREMRLIRFSFAIILLSKCLGVLEVFILLILASGYISEQNQWLFWGLTLTNHIVWGCLAYYVLRSLSVNRVLDSVDDGMEPEKVRGYAPSSKLQRLSHFILDSLLCVVISANLWSHGVLYFRGDINTMMHQLITMMVLNIVLSIATIMYYLFFEVLFGATPAKFLTETRVLSREGRKPGLRTIFLRTAARFVPFEFFSYLGRGDGWHDRWPGTMVVQEKRTGILAGWYLLIIPLLALIGWAGHAGLKIGIERDFYAIEKARFESEVQRIKHALSNLEKGSIIETKVIKENTFYDWVYLKVEDISDNQILLSAWKNDGNRPTMFELDQILMSPEQTLPVLEIDPEILAKCITPDFDYYDGYMREMRHALAFCTNVLNDDGKFEITDIHRIFESDLYDGVSDYSENTIRFGFANHGGPAELIAIDTIEGNLNWTVDLPLRFGSAKESNRYFSISADDQKPWRRFKFRLTVRDDEGHIQKYVMEQYIDRYFHRIFEGHADW